MTESAAEFLRPTYLDDAHDRPRPLRDDDAYSENYLSGAAFQDIGAGVWLHFNRPPHDPTLWDEIFVFMLPGDRFLVSRGGAAAAGDEAGPVGPSLTFVCDEPFRRWTKAFRGTARLVTGAQLRSGPLHDGPTVSVDMQLEWVMRGAAFDMDMSEQSWADVKSHYQQHADVTGHIEFAGERLVLNGSGIRDHSWGPRDLTKLGDHMWSYGQFPSGRQFMVFRHVSPDGGELVLVNYDNGNGLCEGRLVVPPPTPRPDTRAHDPYVLHFAGADGEAFVVHAEILAAMPMGFVGLAEFAFGAPGREAHHSLHECATRFTWHGEIGQGISEWSKVTA